MEGQPIMDLADCQRRFVVVALPERDFATITTGDRAMVRLFGAQEWVTGTVRQARGSAARNDPRLLAAQILNPDERQISIEIALPPVAQKDGVGFCDIGRLAEVRFQRAGFSLASLWRFIAGMIGPHEARVADRGSALAH
jgi:HlyD family secretion protein